MGSGEAEKSVGEHPWALIGRRLSSPWKQWTFFIVFILGIWVLGYLAVWIEVGNVASLRPSPAEPHPHLEPLRLAYATAILAVGGPCLMQLYLSQNKIAIVVGFVLLFLVLFVAYTVANGDLGLGGINCFGIFGLIIAAFCWWLANGEDELFQDRATQGAASGGDPTRELPGGNSGVKT